MATRQFDELKSIRTEIDELSASREIEKYFDEMELSEEEKEKRIKTALAFQKFFRKLFDTMLSGEELREYFINQITNEYIRILDRYGFRPNRGHIERFAETIVDNTLRNIKTEWYTSVNRSINIAESETNNSANYEQYQQAIENGCTTKTWITQNDKQVRESHIKLDHETIGIDQLFQVGNAEMRYPCDEETAFDFPEEVTNCRCSIIYR